MSEPVPEPDGNQQDDASHPALRDMSLRSHLREMWGSMKGAATVFLVLLVLIIIGGGCALLLR